MAHGTKIYSYCRYEAKSAKTKKYSLKNDLQLNGSFYLKCGFIAVMLMFIMRGFLGV